MPIFARATLYEGDLVDTRDRERRPFESLHIRLRPLVTALLYCINSHKDTHPLPI